MAFVPFFILLAIHRNFYAAAILSVPFLVLGARIERDSDWSSPRRRGTLLVVSISTVLLDWWTGGWIVIAAFILAPFTGLAVWFAAGRAAQERDDMSAARPRLRARS